MKKNDIATLIFIVSISFLIAWFTANSLIGSPKSKGTKVQTAETISAAVEEPDTRVFKVDAINPTIDRSIGKSADKLPFTSPEN